MLWETVSFVNRSKNRKLILQKLSKPTTPTALAKELGLHRSVVSRALLSMEKEGLVVCLNPQSKKERYYNLAKRGKLISKKISDISK